MWRQGRLLDLKLWQRACQGAQQSCEVIMYVGGVRRHSSGKQKVMKLERELARLQATSLEQLQEQVKQQATTEAAAASAPEEDFHNLALRAIRESNICMPLVPGQLLKGSIIRVDRKTVWLDVGLAKHAKLFRSQIQLSSVVETTSDAPRMGPNDIRVGDVLHVTLEDTETPFGDPAVSVDMPKGPGRMEKALDELRGAYEKKQQVMGRILNPLNGGYAIGVAGLVGFCPFRLCTLPTASRVGTLQPFYVSRFRREPFNMILEDAHAHEKAEAAARFQSSFSRPPSQLQTAPEAPKQAAETAPGPGRAAPAVMNDWEAAEQEANRLMGRWQPNKSEDEGTVSGLDAEQETKRTTA